MPEVALEVRRLVDDPNASTDEMATIISKDPALSARLLKVSNSALFRRRVEITNLNMAISRLGLTLVKNLVTNLGLLIFV